MYYKLSSYALTAALLTHRANAACTEGTIATVDTCDYSTFVANLSGCTEAEFLALLPIDPDTVTQATPDGVQYTGPDYIAELCEYDAPTQFVEIQGTYQKDRRYFAGGGQLVDGGSWELDAARLNRFNTNLADKTLIAWPNYAARLQYNIDNGLGTNGYPANMNLDTSCSLNTVMCCFTDDSMGPNSFPAGGTTDVCRHELHDSPQSNHIKEGWSVFPGDETSTYCTGFTWTDGQEDLLGNMMYDISLHNTIESGFMKSVPGAPMCGCVEHMPVVEEASCRTASAADITYTFTYDAAEGFSASNSATITYDDCKDGTTVIDLATAYKQNQATDADKALIDAHLVGNGKCEDDLVDYLNEEQFLLQGQHDSKYQTPDDKWSDLVVGEGIYFFPPLVDPIASDKEFRALIEPTNADWGTPAATGCVEADGITPRACIIRRVCSSCTSEPHRDIYYKRLTPLPPLGTNSTAGEVYFLDTFMNQWRDNVNGVPFNVLNVDFKLYSTYQDALDDTNAWTYCSYNYDHLGFPRDCGPKGWVGNQWNNYNGVYTHGDANHNGYYVEKP
jgi:hypothetical protein